VTTATGPAVPRKTGSSAWPRQHGSPRLVVGAALNAFVPWRVGRLRFDGQQGEAARVNTKEIIDAFLLGAKGSFADADEAAFRDVEASVPWTRRPFFWEGHAFGGAAQSACRLSRACTDARYFAPGFRFMFFTGLGFWNAVAAHYFLPEVSLAPERWSVSDFASGGPFIAGGLSFGAVALEGRLEMSVLDRLERLDSSPGRPGPVQVSSVASWWRRGLALGAGRALWFLHMNDYPRIGEILDGAGNDAEDLALGLGVAMTYTQLGQPLEILEGLEHLRAPLRRAAMRGAHACLAGAGRDDPRAVPYLMALPAPLPDWCRQGTDALEHAGPGQPAFFEKFVNALSDLC
jgi:hypothetical protein